MNKEELDYNVRECASDLNVDEKCLRPIPKNTLVKDKEYIEKTVNNFIALKNLSIREIQYKLLAKGLSKSDIEDYLYENRDELEEYEIKSASNIIYKKSLSMELEEIKQYLLKKGYKTENINKAIDDAE